MDSGKLCDTLKNYKNIGTNLSDKLTTGTVDPHAWAQGTGHQFVQMLL